MVTRHLILICVVVLALRLPFLNLAIQGDDVYYLYGAEHAQIEPLHPKHTTYVFQGDVVDMRGHPHGPLNPWILGALLATTGRISEPVFHGAYIIFSLIAALAVYAIARKFCDRPLLATLLFLAVPAFVVNGTSLEADLPFLSFWLGAIALFVSGIEEDNWPLLTAAAAFAGLASLTAYQAVVLTPILAVYLWSKRRTSVPGWLAAVAAPVVVVTWQLWERVTSGALPAAVLAGYMQSYGLQTLTAKLRNAVALIVHSGWMVSPVIVLAAFARGRWRIGLAVAAASAALIYDRNPLFWISVACGVLAISWSFAQRDLPGRWFAIFFVAAIIIFFAGSARYLLPVAAPLAILAARAAKPLWLWTGFALQMALSLTLATANSQHWDDYRGIARDLSQQIATKRVWINGEWGLRHYLEDRGALPLTKQQALRAGELAVSSELGAAMNIIAPTATVRTVDIAPSIPLRLISLSGRSGYSSAARGLLPFEISTAPADRVRIEAILERTAELSYLDPRDPKTKGQWLTGVFDEGGWIAAQASFLFKAAPHPLRVELFIPESAPARRVRMLVDNQVIAEETFAKPGAYALAAPFASNAASITVTIEVDKTYRVPGDRRDLGIVITGIGFR